MCHKEQTENEPASNAKMKLQCLTVKHVFLQFPVKCTLKHSFLLNHSNMCKSKTQESLHFSVFPAILYVWDSP